MLSLRTPLDATLGLDSLDYAELVVRLEGAFGVDPFASGGVSFSLNPSMIWCACTLRNPAIDPRNHALTLFHPRTMGCS